MFSNIITLNYKIVKHHVKIMFIQKNNSKKIVFVLKNGLALPKMAKFLQREKIANLDPRVLNHLPKFFYNLD